MICRDTNDQIVAANWECKKGQRAKGKALILIISGEAASGHFGNLGHGRLMEGIISALEAFLAQRRRQDQS